MTKPKPLTWRATTWRACRLLRRHWFRPSGEGHREAARLAADPLPGRQKQAFAKRGRKVDLGIAADTLEIRAIDGTGGRVEPPAAHAAPSGGD